MSSNSIKHLVLFAVIFGTLIYLLSALWSALFIVHIPMDNSTETFTAYEETLENLKYSHNMEMQRLNGWWVKGSLVFSGVIGLLVFFWIPKWIGKLEEKDDNFGHAFAGFITGIAVALIFPFILGIMLPAPYKCQFPSGGSPPPHCGRYRYGASSSKFLAMRRSQRSPFARSFSLS